jgi:hypothetical protein
MYRFTYLYRSSLPMYPSAVEATAAVLSSLYPFCIISCLEKLNPLPVVHFLAEKVIHKV